MFLCRWALTLWMSFVCLLVVGMEKGKDSSAHLQMAFKVAPKWIQNVILKGGKSEIFTCKQLEHASRCRSRLT